MHSQILFTRLCILFTRLQSDSTQSDSIYTTIPEQDRTGPGAGRGVWWTPKRPKKRYLDCGGSGRGGDMITSIYQNS